MKNSPMIAYPHIAGRLFGTPLMMLPSALDGMIAGISGRLFGDDVALEGEWIPAEAYTTAAGERKTPGYRVIGNVAVIDIFGALVHRGGVQADCSYLLGYETIARRLDAALADPSVEGIVLQLATPGGEVSGAFDLAEQIHAATQIKPLRAVAADLAASAGYLLASAVGQGNLFLTQTANVGSIGVITRHANLAKRMEKMGVDITLIHSGDRKADGHPYGPLPDHVHADLQTRVDGLRGLFVESAARYRGMDAAAVHATEAAVYSGPAAIQSGLADKIATPDQVIAGLQAELAKPTQRRKTAMSGTDNAEKTYGQTDLDKARAEGEQQGAQAATARIKGILMHADAAGREAMAQTLAFDTDMSIEQAAKVLAVAPTASQESPAKPPNPLASAMNNVPNPHLGPAGDGAELSDQQKIDAAWAALVPAGG